MDKNMNSRKEDEVNSSWKHLELHLSHQLELSEMEKNMNSRQGDEDKDPRPSSENQVPLGDKKNYGSWNKYGGISNPGVLSPM